MLRSDRISKNLFYYCLIVFFKNRIITEIYSYLIYLEKFSIPKKAASIKDINIDFF